MHEHSSTHSNTNPVPPDLPPCCGTGCAVCVLDMMDDYAPACASLAVPAAPKASIQTEPLNALPACCNTGCLICVQDYPELFQNGRPDSETTLALLAAMEAAEHALQSKSATE